MLSCVSVSDFEEACECVCFLLVHSEACPSCDLVSSHGASVLLVEIVPKVVESEGAMRGSWSGDEAAAELLGVFRVAGDFVSGSLLQSVCNASGGGCAVFG